MKPFALQRCKAPDEETNWRVSLLKDQICSILILPRSLGRRGITFLKVVRSLSGVKIRDQGRIVSASTSSRGESGDRGKRAGISGVYAVVFKNQGLVSPGLGAQSPGCFLGTVHDLSSLIVEAEYRGRHIPALPGF